MWEYETDEGAHDLYMDQGEEIRFRVVDEVFIDTSPTGPSTDKEPTSAAGSAAPPAGTDDSTPQKESPYTLIVRETIKYITSHFTIRSRRVICNSETVLHFCNAKK